VRANDGITMNVKAQTMGVLS